MSASSELDTALPERPLPAWLFSCLFHLSVVALLVMLVDPVPRGAADEPGREAGIVLKRATDSGDLYEGEASVANAADTPSELSAEELLAALPSETASPDASQDLPQDPAIGAGATAPGGQPNATTFTTGGGSHGAPPGGSQASVRVFGVEGTGTKFVFVFDRSTSMEGAPLAAAKQQLLESLDSLESVHQFQIIFFNTRVSSFDLTGGGNRIAFATERNKTLAEKFVRGITADGGTDRLAALRMAVGLRPDVIFFLTDADDPMPASELAEISQLNRRAGATICTIDFGRGPRRSSANFLTELAGITGGQYGYVDTLRLRSGAQ